MTQEMAPPAGVEPTTYRLGGGSLGNTQGADKAGNPTGSSPKLPASTPSISARPAELARGSFGQAKARFVLVTDPEEIQAIARNDLTDPIGGEYAGAWYAYDWSLKRYRERRAVTANGGQS